jgi:hypothetical protein
LGRLQKHCVTGAAYENSAGDSAKDVCGQSSIPKASAARRMPRSISFFAGLLKLGCSRKMNMHPNGQSLSRGQSLAGSQ